MLDQWYYASQGQQLGPVGLDELKRLLAEGRLKSQDLVWKQGLHDWIPAGQCPELRASEPPPLPPASPPPLPPPIPSLSGATPPPRRTRSFETSVPAPGVPGARAAPGAQGLPSGLPPSSAQSSPSAPGPSSPKAPSRPTGPALSVNDVVAGFFALVGSVILAVVAMHAGSPKGQLLFLFVALVALVSFWVRLSIFLFKSWRVLPWKAQAMKPPLAAAAPWIPLANLYLIFRATQGLSKKTNETLTQRGLPPSAPENLGVAVGVAFVLTIVLPLALPNPGALLYFNAAAMALTWLWLTRQCAASNALLGHTEAARPPLGLQIGVLATGAAALFLALMVALAGPASAPDSGYRQGFTPQRQNIFGSNSTPDGDLLELARQEAARNATFAEQLRNIRNAYSGGQIYWSYPPRDEDEARLRAMIEQEAARNQQFLEQLQQIRRAHAPY